MPLFNLLVLKVFLLFKIRSPARFLHEIVLVDDKSELLHLHEPLEEELKKPFYQGKVKLVRNKEREGLIRARNNGAIAATGDSFVLIAWWCVDICVLNVLMISRHS